MKNIAIIGSGRVGSALGRRWDLNGHEVKLGVRNPDKPELKLLLEATTIQASSVAEAVAFGDVIVFATPPDAMDDVVQAGGDWSGKVVIDSMNRFTPEPEDTTGSIATDLQRLIPDAKVVKAFNSLGADLLLNPTFGAEVVSLFIASDDADAKAVVTELAEEISFDVIDCGPLSNAVHLEHLAQLWVYLSYNLNSRDIAFKLMRR